MKRDRLVARDLYGHALSDAGIPKLHSQRHARYLSSTGEMMLGRE